MKNSPFDPSVVTDSSCPQKMVNPFNILLTPKEMEVLTWGAHGKTSYEISIILDCSEAAINFHFGNIRRKFDVHTRTAALLKASVLGIIALPRR